ncbi:MAG TPA: histidine kinase dimerization/phosphoacceptor domain -containing protein [Spirochaetia bacterium]|nr:histidine kinase dimerization/phosphoacceptor domain -containing protein [Spirochaetia bacterium]
MKRRAKARPLLFAAFFLSSVLPLFLFGAAFWPTLHRFLDEDLRSAAASNLAAAAVQVQAQVFDRPRSVLPSILMLAERFGQGRGGAALDEILEAFAVARPEYAAFLVVDRAGRIEASRGRALAAAGSAYALRARPVPGDVAFSKPFFEEGRLLAEASFANPRRTVVGFLDLDVISSRFVLATSSPNDRAGILDEQGYFVACSDPSRIMDRTPLGFGRPSRAGLTLVLDQGLAYFSSSMPIRGSGWQAVYLSSRAEAEAPLRAFLGRLALVAAASVAGSFAIAVVLQRSLAEPLAHLASRIGMIAAGRYEERLGDTALEEFQGIAVAFNAMADSIQRRDREIQRSEERYRLLFLANRVPALLVLGGSGQLRDANDAAEAYYGYSREELRGMRLSELEAGGGPGPGRTLSAAGGADGLAARHRLRSGALRDVELHAGPISIDEEPHFLVVVFDVTRRRIAEERMASALEEKTLLLKEVYHRVKNNLQIISSLLNMQASVAGDGEVSVALRDGQDRVYAMALVHELVYQMGDLSSIDVAEYASRLATHVADAYSAERELLGFELDELRLELERAIPFGLALNEILSNAFKYASRSAVTLSLRVEGAEGGRALLRVEDGGPGMPEGGPSARSSSLGISLIRGLAEQLHGEVSWSPGREGRGTAVVLSFPLTPPDPDGGRS